MKYPANTEELFNDPVWRGKMLHKIKTFRIPDDPQDVLSEIFLLMLSRKDPDDLGRDYVQRWDSELSGSFHNWIYSFLINYCIKKYKRSNSAGGRLIEKALTLTYKTDNSSESPPPGSIFIETVQDTTVTQDPELAEYCRAIKTILQEAHPAHSWIDYFAGGFTETNIRGKSKTYHTPIDAKLIGHRVYRDAATVFEAISLGAEPSDIEKIFRTSRQFVYTLIDVIRNLEEIQKLRQRA